MLTLVTVIYGSKPTYRTELFGSVLSILKLRQSQDTRILVFTDRLIENFPLPIEQRVITPAEWIEWTRADKLSHLVKLHLLPLTLQECNHPVIYFDTDTLLLTPPESLANRLSAKSVLMHANEGPISNYPIWDRTCEWLGQKRIVQGISISPASEMYNTGIIGVLPAHLSALKNAIPIADTFLEVDPDVVFNIDQMATTSVLGQIARIHTCEDDVLHYWGWRRGFIHHAIEQFRLQHAGTSVENMCRAFDPAAISRLPAIHWQDRLQARLTRWLRGYDADTGFVCLALWSAMRHQHTDTALANVWFNLHLQFLKKCRSDDKIHADLKAELASQHSACMRWLDAGNNLALQELRCILPE